MHIDAHVASEVYVSSQHIGDKFCAVPGLRVAKKVLHDQNKSLPRFQFHFVHSVFKLWIPDELTDVRTVKDASFQLFHGHSWKSMAQLSKAATILVQSYGELLDQTKLDVQRLEEYPVSVHQRVVDDVT